MLGAWGKWWRLSVLQGYVCAVCLSPRGECVWLSVVLQGGNVCGCRLSPGYVVACSPSRVMCVAVCLSLQGGNVCGCLSVPPGTLSVDAQETQPCPLVDCAQLIHFAKEAQLNGDYQLAAQYYQEQLTRDRSDPAHWFDYGVFYMLTADYQKAEECFNYAVSMEQTHLPSLLMCGILAEMGGRLEEAETFFEGATCVDPTNVVAWTLFGELHPDRDGLPEASVVTGSQSCQGSKPGEGYKGGAEAEPSTMRHLATPTRLNTTIYMETVQFLLQNNALQMAQRALAQELLCPEGGLSSSYHLVLARLQLLRAEYGSAESSLKEALNDSFQVAPTDVSSPFPRHKLSLVQE
ncbi:unnamed protein product [Coregonus sp. 'balchen']|nr:unnamed protein product [Coregonus sp. 'balchen']